MLKARQQRAGCCAGIALCLMLPLCLVLCFTLRCVLLSFAHRLQTWRICLASTCWKKVHATAFQHCRCQVRPG